MIKNFREFKKADIVHCHDVFFWYLPLRVIFFKKKVFTTFHGHETIFPPTKKAKLIRKISAASSHGVIHIGHYIEKWYGTKPDVILYGGVYKNKFQNTKANKSPKIKLAYIGRTEHDMGISIYASAIQKLIKKNIQIELHVFGEGKLIKKIQQLGTIHGFSDNVHAKIKDADFILASSYLSILEAFAAKKLVFAVFENSLKRDYFILSPFRDFVILSRGSEELAKKIENYKDKKKEKDKVVEKAYKWAQNQTWEKIADEYLNLWKN
jgi:glycosyltransferase involved in cell wall biosynthesis